MKAQISPRITVLLITYNHAQFIERCLDGIFAQRIDESFSVIVADDASTDQTLAAIRNYAGAHPDVSFSFLESAANLGITKNYQRAFAACRSEYVAVIEGDDYWINSLKLQTQKDFLDTHYEYNLCSVNYYVYEEYRKAFTLRSPSGTGHLSLGARELISDNLVGNFSTCMYRRSALDRIPSQIFETRSYDWIINISCAMDGLVAFLNDPMSVYRIHAGGAWNLLSHTEKLRQQLDAIPEYDRLTDYAFTTEFAVLSDRLTRAISENEACGIEVQAPSLGFPLATTPSTNVLDFMPPIVISVMKLLLPPAMKRHIRKLFLGS